MTKTSTFGAPVTGAPAGCAGTDERDAAGHSAESAKIRAKNVRKVYDTVDGPFVAVDDFSLEVADGEFVAIVGPSGCGKSTLLSMVAGLETVSSGSISITAGPVEDRPSNSVVFQEYAIFPWQTVIENVTFGLKMRGVPKTEREETALYWLDRVGLAKFRNHYPHQISGGMKQRVGIIRALANDPEVLLMDEPLGALDAQTRVVLQEELLRIWDETRKTVLYITHSLEEAVLLGDRVVLMSAQPGRILEIYEIDLPRPRSFETTTLPEFASFRARIWDKLSAEVTRAMEMQA